MSQEPNQTDEYIDDEIVYDDAESNLDRIKKVKDELKKCKEEKQEYLDGWQRSKADFINFKKRSEEDKQSFVKFANEELIKDIIPTLDSFDMAFKNKESWNSVSENWRKGVEYIYNQLVSTLNNYGITQVNPLGEEFDPNKHDSVGEKEGEDGKIVNVVLQGYNLNNKIIRAPQVEVGKKP